METDSSILSKGVTEVDQERSHLTAELGAFEEFREAIRLATPESMADDGSSATSEHLLEKYRTEVMYGLDYGSIYGDSLAESLENELSPAVAEVLLSNKPLTQRRKRNLLVETTRSIERREAFLAELDEERAALETFSEELAKIESIVERLPVCSPQQQRLEELLTVWEQYGSLEKWCEWLLERRQKQLRNAERSIRIFDDLHALNNYLYSELETPYPVLAALAETVERLDSNRTSRAASESTDRPRTC